MEDFRELAHQLGFHIVGASNLEEFLEFAQEQWCLQLEKDLDLSKGQGKIYLDRLEELLGLEECLELTWPQVEGWVREFLALDQPRETI